MISLEPIETLKILEFRNLMSGRFFLVLSFRMLATVLGWWIYQITKDPFAIGLIGLSEVIPAVSSALYAGHVIDNTEKKRLLLICNYAYVILIGFLCFIAYEGNILHVISGKNITYFIYGTIFFTGICRAFIGPLVPAMIPKIVGKERLANAITINQATFLTASVSGHALGGFFIHWFDIFGTLLIIVGLMILASSFFWFIHKHYSENKGMEINEIENTADFFAKARPLRELYVRRYGQQGKALLEQVDALRQ